MPNQAKETIKTLNDITDNLNSTTSQPTGEGRQWNLLEHWLKL